MKLFKTLLTILFISLLSPPSWSAEMGDLVIREGIYYEKFTNVPFNGEVTGKRQGSIWNGMRHGAWIGYRENGQLWYEGNFKNGKRDGAWVSYNENGGLEHKGNNKNGVPEGAWVSYHENGQLRYKGNHKNGKEGDWVGYNKDGTVNKELTGTYKNNEKISD